MTLGSIAFSALGLSEYTESIFNSPIKSFFRIWAEAMTATFLTDLVGMDVLHRWMHTNAYFLHKWHHVGKADLIPAHSYSFDLLGKFKHMCLSICTTWTLISSSHLLPIIQTWSLSLAVVSPRHVSSSGAWVWIHRLIYLVSTWHCIQVSTIIPWTHTLYTSSIPLWTTCHAATFATAFTIPCSWTIIQVSHSSNLFRQRLVGRIFNVTTRIWKHNSQVMFRFISGRRE